MNGDSRGITQGIFAPYPLKERILAEYDAWILGKKSKQFKFFCWEEGFLYPVKRPDVKISL